MILLAFILITVAALSKAVMDEMSHHYDNPASIFCGARGWFKYPNNYKAEIKSPFWRLIMSTILVPFIDAWHFFQFLFLNCFFASPIILMYSGDIDRPVYLVSLLFLFHYFFEFFYTIAMKKTFTIPFIVLIFLLINGGMVISFSLQDWCSGVKIFHQTWFKLLGIAPAFIVTLILYIKHRMKLKNKKPY